MSEPQLAETPHISEPLSWKQICALHPDEWVCIVDVDWANDTDFDFRSARVVGHGKTRREPLDQARLLRERYPSIGHFFTGRVRAPIPRFL